MKGYELMKLVNEGKLSLEQKVSSISPDYKNCTIYFVLKDIAFNIMNLDFEVIEEQQDIDIQSIEELNDTIFDCEHMTASEVEYYHNYTRTKMNEIIRAAKQLDKRTRNLPST